MLLVVVYDEPHHKILWKSFWRIFLVKFWVEYEEKMGALKTFVIKPLYALTSNWGLPPFYMKPEDVSSNYCHLSLKQLLLFPFRLSYLLPRTVWKATIIKFQNECKRIRLIMVEMKRCKQVSKNVIAATHNVWRTWQNCKLHKYDSLICVQRKSFKWEMCTQKFSSFATYFIKKCSWKISSIFSVIFEWVNIK